MKPSQFTEREVILELGNSVSDMSSNLALGGWSLVTGLEYVLYDRGMRSLCKDLLALGDCSVVIITGGMTAVYSQFGETTYPRDLRMLPG